MGRYTTVQSYSDSNANLRAVPYDQARGAAAASSSSVAAAAAPSGAAAAASSSGGGAGAGAGAGAGGLSVDKVHNPYGSTAGAGSGEFHIYRHARSREMARLKALDEAEESAKAEQEFREKVEGWQEEEDRRTEKRRKKRQRQKEARERKKNLKLAGVVGVASASPEEEGSETASADDEFEYIPMQQPQPAEGDDADGTTRSNQDEKVVASKTEVEELEQKQPAALASEAMPFANDGSLGDDEAKTCTRGRGKKV